MDDDDSFRRSWPFWKFGMKSNDFTKLHDRYNTTASTIQDPEAFHSDVLDISNQARDEPEFHRLMAERQQKRVNELNDCLQSTAFEIIANPSLIGTEQWAIAVQLFRTRSLDSLVRYFATYLPEPAADNLHNFSDNASVASTYTDRCSVYTDSTNPSSVDDADGPIFFADHQDKPVMTHEPLSIDTAISMNPVITTTSARSSSRSSTSTMESTDATHLAARKSRHRRRTHCVVKTTRSPSFSGSNSDIFDCGRSSRLSSDDETSQSGYDSVATPTSDYGVDYIDHVYQPHKQSVEHGYEDDFETAQLPVDFFDDIVDSIESDTPTPRPETVISSSYLDRNVTPKLGRASSPFTTTTTTSLSAKYNRRAYRSDGPAARGTSRRSPEEAASRISKPLPDTARTRLGKGQRRGLD